MDARQDDRLVPFSEACTTLGCKKSRMYAAIQNEPGHPQPVKRSGRNFFYLSDLLGYIQKLRQATPTKQEHPAPWAAINASLQKRGKARMTT